jgi:DNA repair protein RadC
VRITKKLMEAGRTMEINVLDHIIIGRKTREGADDFLSLRESGLTVFEGH